jgi:hypothetical protein
MKGLMRRLYVCIGVIIISSVVLFVWWFRSQSVPPLPKFPSPTGNAFALGVIGHTNDAAGKELVSFFYANPKDELVILTPTTTERYDLTMGQWTSVPYEPRQELRISPRSKQAFYLRRPEGESPWRVVLTYSRHPEGKGEGLYRGVLTRFQSAPTTTPSNPREIRTPVLIGVNYATNDFGPANRSQPVRPETDRTSAAATRTLTALSR